MIDRASVELGLNPAVSYVVGDQHTDIELAERVGAAALMIRGDTAPTGEVNRGVPTVADLWEAAHWILDHSKRVARGEELQS